MRSWLKDGEASFSSADFHSDEALLNGDSNSILEVFLGDVVSEKVE